MEVLLPVPVYGDAATPLPSAPAPSPTQESSDFSEILHALGQRIDRGEQLMARALHPRAGMDAAELIALQAGIYRYTEAVELASKLVDRSSHALKTTLQSQ